MVKEVEYNIIFRRIPDGKPPRFPKKPTIRQEGDVLVMECLLEANPGPDITWYQGTKIITNNSRVHMFRKATGKDTYTLTLEISNPTRQDGGNYRCNAFNSFGESNANISLNFQGMRCRIFIDCVTKSLRHHIILKRYVTAFTTNKHR